jgi:hypothetical protein
MTPHSTLNNWTHGKGGVLTIGARYSGSYNCYYKGELNDFRLYATALTEA